MLTARAGDTLSRLAAAHLGNALDWPAVMLATNGRLADGLGLSFIGDPNALAVGQGVFMPGREEADALVRLWRAYERAVLDMSLPEPWEVERDLVVPTGETAVVVTWARDGQYTQPFPTAAERLVWVTAEPHFQDFCRRRAAELGAGGALIERLEQRLGLPPKSNKTRVVRIEVDLDAEGFIRPCTDPRVDRSGCGLPAEGLATVEGYEWYPLWFYRQYHAAYGVARPTRFPWTSLGYTYDWGQEDEYGETEFVILEGTPIRVLEAVPTAEYCAPGR